MLLVVGFAHYLVLLIDEEYGRLVLLSLLRSHVGIRHDDDFIAYVDAFSSRSIEADDARALFASDGIGLKSVAIIDVNNLHLLIFHDARLLQQTSVDSDTAYIVEVSLSDNGAMYLCF